MKHNSNHRESDVQDETRRSENVNHTDESKHLGRDTHTTSGTEKNQKTSVQKIKPARRRHDIL